MKRKIGPFIENISESTMACLVTMVQGNVMVLGVGHWVIASRTGIIAGVVASLAILLARTKRRWVVAAVLGTVTAVVDYFVHPGNFGPVFVEAIVTGLGAALLSYLIGVAVRRFRKTSPAAG